METITTTERDDVAGEERVEVRPARNDRELLISRTFAAPRDVVFHCWMDEEHATQWWGPRGFTATSFYAEAEPGGRWRTCMKSHEYGETCSQGVFREIVENEKLVYTWAWEDDAGKPGHETLITIDFVDEGEQTRMHFRQGPFESAEDRESHDGGWNECFDKLDEHLARKHQHH
jgi:uncharacterized protein YndB with AHSA1/START domain